jgi:hypothetical protein
MYYISLTDFEVMLAKIEFAIEKNRGIKDIRETLALEKRFHWFSEKPEVSVDLHGVSLCGVVPSRVNKQRLFCI